MKTFFGFVRNGSIRMAFILTLVLTAMLMMLSMWQNLATARAMDDPGRPESKPYLLQVTGTLTRAAFVPIVRRNPLPTPTNTTQPFFFFDDFSNPASGWVTGTNGPCKYEYANGIYRITVSDNNIQCIGFNTFIGSKPNGTFKVQVRRITPSDRLLLYGFFFGAGSNANDKRWALEVRPHRVDCEGTQRGFYWLSYKDGSSSNLVGKGCTTSINTGTDEWNELEVIRDSSKIKVYINGFHRDDFDNNRLRDDGYFDLVVTSNYPEASSSRPVIVEFDNFLIE